ncbi:hypothetical protein [Streptomyces sp. NPDC059631]|uniref:hypothetical protein n=1 Tax=unclassified Streptomyces TaxID=2593676 RepID=UPI00369CDEC3
MLAEEWAALAAAGGTAVAQAAGTSTWQGFQRAVARWFARGDEGRERIALERLDRSANALYASDDGELEQARRIQQAVWQTRFADALESLDEGERVRAAEVLRALLDDHAGGAASAGDGGVAVSGNVSINADHGSAAALNMGDVSFSNPR